MPEPYQSSRFTPERLRFAGFVALGLAALVVALGVFSRVSADHRLQRWSKYQATPSVNVVKIKSGQAGDMTLPGEIQAFNSAQIHARTAGYLKRWYVDIGQQVKAGQLLAEIDTPDLDQQVMQARADVAAAQANEKLSSTTAKRWTALLAQDAVSKQAVDEKMGDLAAKTSATNAAKANLNRLLALAGFKRVTAPFDGVITTRDTDVGALIGASGGDTPLFTVSDQRRLRIYVRVPQTQAALVRAGQSAVLSVPEYPGVAFTATVVRDAGAVDAASGTVLVELQIGNADGRLKPGAYAQVVFKLPASTTAMLVPATALQFRHEGPVLATVGPGDKIKIKPVIISRDLGASVEIGSGISPGDRVVDNPMETISDGDVVHVNKG